MIRNLLIVLLLIGSVNCFAQSKNPQYDAQLAQKLGADDYGMKTLRNGIFKSRAKPAERFCGADANCKGAPEKYHAPGR